MKIGMGIETSGEEILPCVMMTSDFIAKFEENVTSSKNYGIDLDDILVGYTCGTGIVTSRIHTERRPRFLKQPKRLEFDIRFISPEILAGEQYEFLTKFVGILCQKLSHETKKRKLKFDVVGFETDIRSFEKKYVVTQD